MTAARLAAVRSQAVRLDSQCVDPMAHYVLMLEQVHAMGRGVV